MTNATKGRTALVTGDPGRTGRAVAAGLALLRDTAPEWTDEALECTLVVSYLARHPLLRRLMRLPARAASRRVVLVANDLPAVDLAEQLRTPWCGLLRLLRRRRHGPVAGRIGLTSQSSSRPR